ncbi:MAG: protein-L-isoaspartate(D-aspartate) O-methyltransferase [candidate division NC10 bacterium]|nr:protein-L-isoaspartate(D-aspartate) O-methyltransferase [candidate division NC10 bacterium]
MDYAIARERMVAEQLVSRGIRDPRVLEVMGRVPRHLFVEEALASRAYSDYPLPIGEKQTISQPYMVALMTEALELEGMERVLEIGTGSGYQTAILADLSAKVYSIERIKSLADRATRLLDQLGYYNVLIKVGDGTLGWKEEAPFDGIMVTAAAPYVPPTLLEQLGEGGRIVIPVGDAYSQILKKITKGKDYLRETSLASCVFVKLVGEQGWNE